MRHTTLRHTTSRHTISRHTSSLLLRTLTSLALSLYLPQAIAQKPATPTTTLQTGTQLVVVDVVVTDKQGQPVHGLKSENFQLTENKAQRSIRSFEEHTSAQQSTPPPPLALPPGTYTDYTPVPSNAPLNILLIDALNTPTTDQNYVRDQLKKYLASADPHTRIAIFGLGQHLIFLQGFTSDPAVLKSVVEGKLVPHSSSLLQDPTGSGAAPLKLSDEVAETGAGAPGADEVVANLKEMEAQESAQLSHLQLQYTLDAFNELAHYLINFPGRKNLIWFSGSFPIDVLPDASLRDPFAAVQQDDQEFRETTSLLSKAQVAVYPISAGGLKNDTILEAANSGRRYATANPSNFTHDLNQSGSDRIAQQTTMQQMAQSTGGQAFINTNDLASAVTSAIHDGANFYTLTYSPADHENDGRFREIQVRLTGIDTSGLHLAYRRGYYAEDANHATRRNIANNQPGQPAPANAYARAAMLRGAPTPQDILFKVRVAPEIPGTELEILPANQPDRSLRFVGPFRRYGIDFISLPQEFSLTLQPDGTRKGHIEFMAFLYDAGGKLLNVSGKSIALTLTPQQFARFQQSSVNLHLDLSVPTGEDTFLRIGVHDLPSNRFGVVELPASDVATLPVVPAPTTPSTPSPASPAPSTPSPQPAPSPR